MPWRSRFLGELCRLDPLHRPRPDPLEFATLFIHESHINRLGSTTFLLGGLDSMHCDMVGDNFPESPTVQSVDGPQQSSTSSGNMHCWKGLKCLSQSEELIPLGNDNGMKTAGISDERGNRCTVGPDVSRVTSVMAFFMLQRDDYEFLLSCGKVPDWSRRAHSACRSRHPRFISLLLQATRWLLGACNAALIRRSRRNRCKLFGRKKRRRLNSRS